MLAVIMEEGIKKERPWKGLLGALNNYIFCHFSKLVYNFKDYREFQIKCDELYDLIMKKIQRTRREDEKKNERSGATFVAVASPAVSSHIENVADGLDLPSMSYLIE